MAFCFLVDWMGEFTPHTHTHTRTLLWKKNLFSWKDHIYLSILSPKIIIRLTETAFSSLDPLKLNSYFLLVLNPDDSWGFCTNLWAPTSFLVLSTLHRLQT